MYHLLEQIRDAAVGMITKRGEVQQAKVRRKGSPARSLTFMNRKAAEKWVCAVEYEPDNAGFIDLRDAASPAFLQAALACSSSDCPIGRKSGKLRQPEMRVAKRYELRAARSSRCKE